MRAIKLSLVAIGKDNHRIFKQVNTHEVPILRELHGDDDRFQVIDKTDGFVVSDISDADEYERLRQVYGKKPESYQIFKSVYRDVEELGEAIGNHPVPTKRKPKAPPVVEAVSEAESEDEE